MVRVFDEEGINGIENVVKNLKGKIIFEIKRFNLVN